MNRNSSSIARAQEPISLPSSRGETSMSDQVLLSLAQEGEPEAFEALVKRYRTLLLRCIMSYIRSQDEAHDVLQHVLLQLYLSLPTLSTAHPIKPWLFRVAHNSSIDALRKKRRHPTLPFSSFGEVNEEEDCPWIEAITDSAPSPQEQIERQEQYDRFQQALAHLPQRFREIVILRCRDNLRFAEVARQLAMPESTIKTYYGRAQRLLRTMFAS